MGTHLIVGRHDDEAEVKVGGGLLIVAALVEVLGQLVGALQVLHLKVVVFLQGADESLRVLHALAVLENVGGLHDGRHLVLELLEGGQHLCLALHQRLGHLLAEMQTLAGVHRVIDHVRLVHRLQDVLQQLLLVVDLKRNSHTCRLLIIIYW